MNANRTYGLGLIGCGAFGRFCLETYAGMPGLRPTAVCDLAAAAADAAAEYFSLPAHYDPQELIARDDVDIVHVATPPSSHHALVMAAVHAGKHVLCEKPLAMRVAEADEMLAAARSAGVIVPVDFVLRYNRVTDAVSSLISSGVLGRPLAARLTNCAADGGLPPGHWFWNRAVSGGIFVEHGVHFFDLYRHWMGPGTVISSHTESRAETDQQDRVTCMVHHDSGTLVSHYHAFDQLSPMDRTDHRIVFELGDVHIEGWIPLTLRIDAAVDDQALDTIRTLCPGAEERVCADYDPEVDCLVSRGVQRAVTQRMQFVWTPDTDKQRVYATSVRDLMADQVAFLGDRTHERRVAEENGRAALAMAERAVETATSGISG